MLFSKLHREFDPLPVPRPTCPQILMPKDSGSGISAHAPQFLLLPFPHLLLVGCWRDVFGPVPGAPWPQGERLAEHVLPFTLEVSLCMEEASVRVCGGGGFGRVCPCVSRALVPRVGVGICVCMRVILLP